MNINELETTQKNLRKLYSDLWNGNTPAEEDVISYINALDFALDMLVSEIDFTRFENMEEE